jgi:DNA mismatch repair ATPase MutS
MTKKILLASMTLILPLNLLTIDTSVAYQAPIPTSYTTMLDAITPSLSALRENEEIISPLDRYKTALDILQQGAKDRKIESTPPLNATTISDLGILFYDVSKPNFTVLKKINRTKTTLGECSLGALLVSPLTNSEKLRKRQEIIRFLVQDDEARTTLHNIVDTFAKQEDQLLALWNKNDLMYSKNMGQALFNNNLKKKLSATRFEISRRFHDIVEPSSPLITYLASRFIKKLVVSNTPNNSLNNAKKINPTTAVFDVIIPGFTVLGAAIALKTSYSKFKNRSLLVMALKKRFQSLVKLGESLMNLSAFARKYENYNVPALDYIKNFSGTHNDDIHAFFDNLTSRAFSEETNYFTAFIGPLLSAVPQFLSIKDRLCPSLHALGELDSLLSIATLVKEHENFTNHYCYAEYITSETTPLIEIDQFWHPNLPAQNAIPNSIQLGGKNRRNAIITGSNAGGKSTNIKALMLAILFAQTITVVAASKITLTLFTLLNTYLNIVEDAGNAISQHRAEVRRANELISMIQKLLPNEFSITVMDEMFRCTNPATGAAAAFAIGKELGKLKNSFLLLATHYHHLTKLADEPESSFVNLCVDAIKNEDGSFTYPYKLREGINATVIALDMLAHEGFDQRILDYAYEHLARVESKEEMSHYINNLRQKIEPK